MKVGVVSDTHNNLKNVRRIVELFNEACVERVVHTGDITQAKVIEAFSALDAPLFGVYGNNDQGELPFLVPSVEAHGFHFVQPPLTLSWAGREIVVVHSPEELIHVSEDEFDVILHGHTHRETIDYQDDRLTFNPGESAGMMEGYNAIGILDLVDLTTDLIRF